MFIKLIAQYDCYNMIAYETSPTFILINVKMTRQATPIHICELMSACERERKPKLKLTRSQQRTVRIKC